MPTLSLKQTLIMTFRIVLKEFQTPHHLLMQMLGPTLKMILQLQELITKVQKMSGQMSKYLKKVAMQMVLFKAMFFHTQFLMEFLQTN